MPDPPSVHHAEAVQLAFDQPFGAAETVRDRRVRFAFDYPRGDLA
jgi:hypothetical protein